ncbi:SDR family oxidoreductase [Plantactinospora sp. CA-294935]|uniref:SDR family oxidoreductase n=1 Tax=Plantactinospora sp. CA-294935 TaxID=3240012 RepID=UPI003D8E9833
MPTIAIVGAGPGLGRSIPRVFGRHGFDVALISRRKDNLDALVAQLAKSGVNAAGFPADVPDRPSMAATMEKVIEHFGTVDVLGYSPSSAPGPDSPAEVTVDDIQIHLDPIPYGALTAAQAVLPAMLKTGSGTCCSATAAAPSSRTRHWPASTSSMPSSSGFCRSRIRTTGRQPRPSFDQVRFALTIRTPLARKDEVYGGGGSSRAGAASSRHRHSRDKVGRRYPDVSVSSARMAAPERVVACCPEKVRERLAATVCGRWREFVA